MTNGAIFQLITPIVCFAFSAAFFAIYVYGRNKLSILLFATSYLVGSLAFVVDIFRYGLGEVTASFLVNGLYLSTLCLIVAALAVHFTKPIPVKYLAFVSTITMAIMAWYLLGDYSVTMRTATVNFGSGLMLLPALGMVPRKNCAVIYKAIFWILVATFVQFYIRTILTMYLVGDPLTMENYRNSIYLIAFNFSMTLASVGLGLTLCIAIGMEEITNFQRLSETDALSGLINRRGFEQDVTRHIELAQDRKVPLCLIVCDIDHFKSVNDTYGHATGDWVIKDFGKIIKSSCRRTDLVARVGGEEFCILLPVATKEMALLVANNAREKLLQKNFRDVPKSETISASFGISQLEPGDTYADLFKRADEALYEAKQTGRNKCVISGNTPQKPKSWGMQARSN